MPLYLTLFHTEFYALEIGTTYYFPKLNHNLSYLIIIFHLRYWNNLIVNHYLVFTRTPFKTFCHFYFQCFLKIFKLCVFRIIGLLNTNLKINKWAIDQKKNHLSSQHSDIKLLLYCLLC
jgi:hypothetical protein